jgi:hypothetical protein
VRFVRVLSGDSYASCLVVQRIALMARQHVWPRSGKLFGRADGSPSD